MTVNIGKRTDRFEGSAGGGAYQDMGVGNTEAAYREATRKGPFPGDNEGPGRSQGETPGAGTIYAAQLVERPNLSNPRNRGPERTPSRIGGTAMPIVEMDARETGRISK